MAKIVLTVDGTVLKELPLTKSRITVGRRAGNDLVINHVAVSGVHAAIVEQQGKYFVEDLNSTNGTQVNGSVVDKQALRNKDVIDITPYQITFLTAAGRDAAVAEPAAPLAAADEPAGEMENTDGHTMLQQFSLLRVLDGPSAGEEMPLTKPMTTFGRPGVQVAVLTQRKLSYFISHVEGDEFPLVNGRSIGENARMLKYDDVIDLSGTRIKFCRDE
jgi:hypothetical protein